MSKIWMYESSLRLHRFEIDSEVFRKKVKIARGAERRPFFGTARGILEHAVRTVS